MAQYNLTEAETAERGEIVSVDSYEVLLGLTGKGETFRSVTTVRFSAQAGSSTFIDAIVDSVHSITLNGRAVDPDEACRPGRILLNDLAADNVLTVDAEFFYMNTGEGLHRFTDPVDDEVYLYTQFEVPDARRVFAVFEQPDLKADFSFTVVAPEHWDVVSNSPTPAPAEPGADAEVLGLDGQDLKSWRFAPTPRISSYITALVAGPYRSVHDELVSSDGSTVPLGVYARASLFDHLDPENIFDITKRGFVFFEELFDTPYPFAKYDQLFVPEFNAGAMENAGAVTIVEDYVFRSRPTEAAVERRAVTILHELAHMWFGDLVTMKWWDDLWLNESFAEFMSTLATAEATEFSEAWATFAASEKSWAYAQDQLPSTHPIAAGMGDLVDIETNFDGITYAKGASVLKQLVAYVGRENFFRGVKSYFDKHAWSNTRLADLLTELEAASGRDLQRWTRLWIQESGVNILRPQYEEEDGLLTELTVVQQPCVLPGHEVPSLRPHRLGVGLYSVLEGRLKRTALHEIDVDGEAAEVPVDEDTPVPDLIVVNDGDLTYAKVRLDERGLKTVRTHFGDLNDSLTQLVVLGSVWDMARDAEIPVTDYISLVCDNLEHLVHSTGLQTHLRQLETAVFSYTPPALRDTAAERTAEALWAAAGSAPEGSDQQFQFLRGFVSFAKSDDQLRLLAQLLSGEQPLPEGQKLDDELRWHMLTALAGHNRAGEDDIERTLQADNTAAGQRSAARAEASIPTPAAKTAAFRALTEDSGLPNAVLSATARGFASGLQKSDGSLITAEAPFDDFAAEYFARAESWWDTQTLEIAQTLTLWLFPPATEATVAMAEQWLEEHREANRGLQRTMVENLDRARRALAVQRRSEHP